MQLEHTKFDLITDTCCDIPFELAQKLKLEYFKFEFVLDDTTYTDDLWQSMDALGFYNKMSEGAKASTSAYPIGKFVEYFTAQAQANIPTVYLSIPEGISSCIDFARQAVDMVKQDYPDAELYVESALPSAASVPLLIEAVKRRDRGLSAEEFVQWVREVKSFVHGYFTLDSLDRLAQGGRIPLAASQLSNKLDIKANLSYDLSGALTLFGVSRGRKRALKAIAEKFKTLSDESTNMPVIMSSAGTEKDVEYLEGLIRKDKRFEDLPILHATVGPVVGCHVGPGMIGIAFFGNDRRLTSSISEKIAKHIKS